jgi:hypothetical protein
VLCEEEQLPGQWLGLAQWMVVVFCVTKTSYLDSGLSWPSGWVLYEEDQLPGPMSGAGPVDGCCVRKTSGGRGWYSGWVLCEKDQVPVPGQWPGLAHWMGVMQ